MINFDTIQKTLIAVLSLVLIVAGMKVIGKSQKQDYAETTRVGFNVLVGIIIAALGIIGISFGVFGKQLLGLVGVTV